MFKIRVILLLLLSLLFSAVTYSQNAEKIMGIWKATDLENANIKLYKAKNGKFYGKVIDSEQKELIDKLVVTGLVYHEEDNVWKGEIHSLKRGITVDAEFSLEDDDTLKLVGTKFFMTKTFYWYRAR